MIMGGGPDAPSKPSSSEKQLVLCTLPWPQEKAEKGIAGLKEEFNDVEVEYYYTKPGKELVEIPEGMFSKNIMQLTESKPVLPCYRCCGNYWSRFLPLTARWVTDQ
jgi:hypothetical protein